MKGCIKIKIEDVLKRIPKIDLHCHLSGSIRPETILEIAQKENIKVPAVELESFKSYVQVSKDCRSLKEYLTKYDLTLKVMQRQEYLYRITDEFLEDMTKQNVKYIEIRFAPFFHLEGGLTFEEAVEAVLKAMEDGRKKYGILSNLLLICMRHHPVENSMQVVERGKAYIGKGVAGIDLAGNEHDFPPEIHRAAFQLAREYGFHRTVHAGETGIPENIITSVEELFAERIGHGVHAFKDKRILEYVKKKKVPLEMCISSNVQTKAVESIEAHPIKSYLEQGIIVTVNTDATTVSNTTLAEEYQLLIEKQGFSLEDIKKIILNAVEAAFVSEEEKKYLKGIYEEEFKQIIRERE